MAGRLPGHFVLRIGLTTRSLPGSTRQSMKRRLTIGRTVVRDAEDAAN
jgi:hypothetical protein